MALKPITLLIFSIPITFKSSRERSGWLKWEASGLSSFLIVMSEWWPFILMWRGFSVSPIYCMLRLLQLIMYTMFFVLHVKSWVLKCFDHIPVSTWQLFCQTGTSNHYYTKRWVFKTAICIWYICVQPKDVSVSWWNWSWSPKCNEEVQHKGDATCVISFLCEESVSLLWQSSQSMACWRMWR